jgi:hypothetical protein
VATDERGLQSKFMPDPTAEVGYCVHCIANVLCMQKHWDVMRGRDDGESWHEVSENLPTDSGFPIGALMRTSRTLSMWFKSRAMQRIIRLRKRWRYIAAGRANASRRRSPTVCLRLLQMRILPQLPSDKPKFGDRL